MTKQATKQTGPTKAAKAKIEKPCQGFFDPYKCKDTDGRDHCFNCTRHLDPSTLKCPKGCGDHGDEHDEKIADADQDVE